jgi:hypothetical protein
MASSVGFAPATVADPWPVACIAAGSASGHLGWESADFHENDHRFQLKAINDFILGDHHRSEATLAF